MYGRAPTWSSCPWVSSTARTGRSRAVRYEKSGRIRSTPRCSSRGNASPASTTIASPSASTTVMFFPTSPSPPRAMIRTLPGAAALAAELLEEPDASRIREPLGPGAFRVASGVDLAAVIVLGPWRGAFVAGAAALVARLMRGAFRPALFQAAAFALASLAAGYAFGLGGGHVHQLKLPEDLVALTALAVVY